MAQWIDELLPVGFSGAVCILRGDEIVLQAAYGYSDRANKVPNTVDTRFATASAGKFFVAVGVLKLIEEGLLSFWTNIGSVLKFDLKGIDPKITIEQLLTHTSGIADYFDESTMTQYADLWKDFPCYRVRKSSDLLPLFVHKPMKGQPGDPFDYSNAGFVLLDLMIEATTGMPFDRFLERTVFEPCGMKRTGYYEMDRLPKNCAASYILDEASGVYFSNIFSVDAKGTGAGGAFSAVGDICSLWRNLLEGRVLSLSLVERMLSKQVPAGDQGYGFGVWITERNNRAIPYFQGCDPGVSFISSFDRANGLCIVAASNMCNNVWKLESDIYDYLVQEPHT